MTDSNVLQSLRAHTRVLHAELDNCPAVKDLTEGMSRDRYVAFLKASHIALRPIEAWLKERHFVATEAEAKLISENLWRVDALQRDLSSLGVSAVTRSEHKLEIASTNASTFGILYVIEGSTMGAIGLYKSAASKLGVTQESGAAYLWARNPELAPRFFGAFCKALQDQIRDNEAVLACCEAAAQTFGIFQAAFSQDTSDLG